MPSINYNTRDFNSVRTELINYIKQYYPETLSAFNDAGVGAMLIDLNSAVADMLSHHTDRAFNETKLIYAQEKSSLMDIARNYGLKIPFYRASATILDISVTLPVNGDAPDYRYAPIINAGSKFNGGGQIFETKYDSDFANPFNGSGIPNRTVIPNYDANNNIINYTITKRELITNGSTIYYNTTINTNNYVPFPEFILPEKNVLEVLSVIILPGTNYQTIPEYTQFFNDSIRWYEVDSLADDLIFVEDKSGLNNGFNVKRGKYIRTNKRFITEYTDNGFIKLIFGGGTQDVTSLCDFNVDKSLVNMVGDFINNSSFGVIPPTNSTMFVKYRIGGGSNTNVGPNSINAITEINATINGPLENLNTAVRNSIIVTNPLPALGGKDPIGVEELRNLIRYNFASQNRAVTLNDYRAIIGKMPGQYGIPFRYNIMEEQNKIKIYILSLNQDGTISEITDSVMSENIATYLSDYRMINDYVEVTTGKVYNLGFEVDLFIDKKYSQSQIISQAINNIRDYFDINNWDMGDNIYLSQLLEKINNIDGVLNVIDLRVFNNVGKGIYSSFSVSQPYTNEETRQINLLNENILYGDPYGMFEIKYPETDIKIRVKNL